ncbi:hypothetical protein ABE10_02675 [Bacillus toyonensis]|nr:hypothetical protein [Bacillus toyonensis]
MLSLTHRIAATTVALMIPLSGVVGGIVGSDIAQRQTAAINVHNFVTDMVTASEVRLSYDAGVKSRAADTAFQPALDQALALVESSVGKASDASRTALSEAVSTYVSEYRDVSFQDGREALTAQTAAQETAQSAIDAATQTVNAEVAAWQAAEDARIAEEAAAAERAAEEARKSASSNSSRSNSSGSSHSNSGSSGGSSNGGGSSNSGRAWAESIIAGIAPGIPVQWGYSPARGSYGGMYSGGTIHLSDSVADRSGYAYSIIVHEATHAGPQRGSCYSTWQGHFAGDAERFAQAYTQAHFGTTVGAYASPTQADIDAATGC